MDSPPIAAIAALIGDPARAMMLSALMDGRARTATELADLAGIGRSAASAHLAKLLERNMLALERQGRHRYFRLQSGDVAAALEGLLALSAGQMDEVHVRISSPEREARTCYDHLAGRLGVAVLKSLTATRCLDLIGDSIVLTEPGVKLMTELGLDVDAVSRRPRNFTRLCLDWSERRHHLGGALGAALLDRFVEQSWIKREPAGRAVSVTPKGAAAFRSLFGIESF